MEESLLRLFVEGGSVVNVLLRYNSVLGVGGLCAAHQGLDREQCCSDGQSRAPLVLEDVQTNRPGH